MTRPWLIVLCCYVAVGAVLAGICIITYAKRGPRKMLPFEFVLLPVFIAVAWPLLLRAMVRDLRKGYQA